MFISKVQKEYILNSIESLRSIVVGSSTEILYLKAKVKVLEEKNQEPKPVKLTEEELKTELKKARQRAYAKAYYQRKKERDQVLHVGS